MSANLPADSDSATTSKLVFMGYDGSVDMSKYEKEAQKTQAPDNIPALHSYIVDIVAHTELAEAAVVAVGATQPPVFTAVSGHMKQIHILVVDESDINRKMVIRAIERCIKTCSQELSGGKSKLSAQVVAAVSSGEGSRGTNSTSTAGGPANSGSAGLTRWANQSDPAAGLSPIDYSIAQANDGVPAVEMVRDALGSNSPFDVVFMDNVMLDMNGTEAAAKMREAGHVGSIVGVTGNVCPPAGHRRLHCARC